MTRTSKQFDVNDQAPPEQPKDKEPQLIGIAPDAVVQIEANSDYEIRPRTFGSLRQLAGNAYKPVFDSYDPDDVAYAGAVSPTQAHATVITPWYTNQRACFYGSTLGHYQSDPSHMPNEILEVYEVQSGYAALLLDSPDEPTMKLVLLQPGDKIGTPNNCIMTIFCLGDRRTVLWDIASEQRHQADKEIQQKSGPSLILSFSDGNFRAAVSRSYVDRSDGFGVVMPRTADPIAIPVQDNRSATIHASLLSDRVRRQFELRGIMVVVPDIRHLAEQMCVPSSALQGSIRTVAKKRPGHPVRDYLFRDPVDERRHVAIVGGDGHLARTRVIPAMTEKRRRFDCVEGRNQPAVVQQAELPQPQHA